MLDNENLVTEEETEVAENTEETVEETLPEKKYTEDEMNAKVNEILSKKIARREAKIRKEYERKYGDLESVLKAGTGKETVEEMTDTFADFYSKKGIKITKRADDYAPKDIERLARVEADEIIGCGFDEVVEEVDRLTDIGFDNMTARDKAVFKILAEHRSNAERGNELAQIGVKKEVYDSEEFKEFAAQFNSSTPIRKVYDLYTKTQPKKEYQTMGSMKQTPTNAKKDYYSPEEIDKLTEKDLDDPEVWEAVRRSMTGR